MRLAERMDNIGTETAFEAAARARALAATGRDVIHLHLGEPDFDTPPNIVEAAARALRGRPDALRAAARACPSSARPSRPTSAGAAASR